MRKENALFHFLNKILKTAEVLVIQNIMLLKNNFLRLRTGGFFPPLENIYNVA